jgi:hypothetical protein
MEQQTDFTTTEDWACEGCDAMLPAGTIFRRFDATVAFDGISNEGETVALTKDGWVAYNDGGEFAPTILTCPACTKRDREQAGFVITPDDAEAVAFWQEG